jgi:general secretion pathway protein L
MQHLLIRIHSHNSKEPVASWALWENGVEKSANYTPYSLSQIAGEVSAIMQNKEVTVLALLPAEDILLTSVSLPAEGARHLQKMLPFLVEEKLADDVENLHIISARHSSKKDAVPVAVISKKIMHGWIDILSPFQPAIMISEVLALPLEAGAITILLSGGQAWIRTGEYGGYQADAQLFPAMLDSILSENNKSITSVNLYSDSSPGDFSAYQQQYPHLQFNCYPCAGVDSFMMRSLHSQLNTRLPVFNLSQGYFAAKGSYASLRHIALRSVLMLAIWFTAQMVIDGAQAWYFASEAAKMRGEQLSIYTSLYPSETRIIDPVAQMKQHTAQSDGGNINNFNGMLAAVAKAWAENSADSPVLTSLHYEKQNNILELELQAPTEQAVEHISNLLKANNLDVTLSGSSKEGSNMKAQLSLKGAP